MQSNTVIPIVSTTKMRETRAFYLDQLGLQVSFDHERYLGVRAGKAGSCELGFMQPDAEHPDTFDGLGICFAIVVENADTECERLRNAAVPILQEPTDMPWGARAFVIADPNGIKISVSHQIPAAAEFADCIH